VTKITPKLVIAALMAASIAAVTLFLRVPIPKSGGYLNLGDILVIFCGAYLGPLYGALAGGIGSAVADAVGYPIFIIPTLIIKGLEGFIPGLLQRRGFRLIGCFVGAGVMVVGYYFAEDFVFAGKIGHAAAVTELPFNLIQGMVGASGGYLLSKVINRLSEEQRDDDAKNEAST